MTTNTNEELITSPLGDVQYAALRNMVKKNQTDEEVSVYLIKAEYDGNTEAGQEFKKRIIAVNPRIVVEKEDGKFVVKGTTKFVPKIFAPDGEELTGDDIPRFSRGSTAKVTMTLKPYQGKVAGGVKLIAVQFHEMNIVQGASTEETRQNTTNKLREMLSAAAKQ